MEIETISCDDVVKFYLSSFYKRKIAVVIWGPLSPCGVKWIRNKIQQSFDVVGKDYIIIEMGNIQEALDLCHSIPESLLYCVVWDKFEIVSENT